MARPMPQRPLRVLYLQPDGTRSGSSRSLLELIDHLPKSAVEPLLIAPEGGLLADARARGISTIAASALSRWDRTAFGHYRGIRRLIALRELAALPASYSALRRARSRWGAVDLIHANEINALPSARIAKHLFAAPLVMHVRSVQQTESDSRPAKHGAQQLIAIDETVRRSLGALDVPCEVIHNSFTPRPVPPEVEARMLALFGARGSERPLTVAMVGTLLRLKGVFEFLDAARICVAEGVDARFVLVGENVRQLRGLTGRLLERTRISEDVDAALRTRIAEHGLADRVTMLGFTPHIEAVYRNIDLLCFPSYLNAPGRPVIEAALFGVPSAVAVSEPTSDTLIDGVTGWTIAPRSPESIAALIARLARERDLLERAGRAARTLAERLYDGAANAERVLAIYRLIAASDAPRR